MTRSSLMKASRRSPSKTTAGAPWLAGAAWRSTRAWPMSSTSLPSSLAVAISVYGVTIEPDGTVVLDMTLTTAACPLTDVIEEQAAQALALIADDVRIQWVWLPPWGPDKITPEGREQLRALGFNV